MASEKGRRNTQQRQVILEELRKLKSHPTAADLYTAVRRRLPRISLGTIYRNLDLLARDQVIKRLDTGVRARFDGDVDRHNHIRCLECGRVDDLYEMPDKYNEHKLERVSGYTVIDCRLEFIGVCPACRKKQKSDHKRVQH